MAAALDWYREQVCKKHGHTHGEQGELDCLLQELAKARTHGANA